MPYANSHAYSQQQQRQQHEIQPEQRGISIICNNNNKTRVI